MNEVHIMLLFRESNSRSSNFIFYLNFIFVVIIIIETGFSLCRPSWPGICYIDQAGSLKLKDSPYAFKVRELKVCATVSGLIFVLFIISI